MKRILIILMVIMSAISPAIARQPQKGYRGFIDWSNSYRTRANFPGLPRSSTFYSGISTSHGYQINSIFFAGVGLDFEHCSSIKSNSLAFFAEGRADLKFGKFTPFGDIRLGYGGIDGEGGLYFAPSIGYRLNWGRKVGINFSLGLSLKGYSRDIYDLHYSKDPETNYIYFDGEKIGVSRGTIPFLTFRVGFDF